MTIPEAYLRDKLGNETDEFIGRIKAEVLKTVDREVEEYVTDYIYEEIENVIDQVIAEVKEKGKSIIKSKSRKVKIWFRRVFR